ncbi:HAD family phosphatase [Candidatus Roizmanbacteria bacterium]|nr:HAD family phosphatase [Candidatus Roizmanbacteria bacterium]
MIKAVIVDVGGVLIDKPVTVMFAYYSSRLKVSIADFKKALSFVDHEWSRGILTEKDFWQRVAVRLRVNEPTEKNLWANGFKLAYKEKQEVLDLIGLLKKQGYELAILSNTEPPVRELFVTRKFPHFSHAVYSCEVGMMKPNRDIYDYTLSKLGVKPQEAVFIDDKQENIAGAKKAGIPTIIFTDIKTLKTELKKLNVRW